MNNIIERREQWRESRYTCNLHGLKLNGGHRIKGENEKNPATCIDTSSCFIRESKTAKYRRDSRRQRSYPLQLPCKGTPWPRVCSREPKLESREIEGGRRLQGEWVLGLYIGFVNCPGRVSIGLACALFDRTYKRSITKIALKRQAQFEPSCPIPSYLHKNSILPIFKDYINIYVTTAHQSEPECDIISIYPFVILFTLGQIFTILTKRIIRRKYLHPYKVYFVFLLNQYSTSQYISLTFLYFW